MSTKKSGTDRPVSQVYAESDKFYVALIAGTLVLVGLGLIVAGIATFGLAPGLIAGGLACLTVAAFAMAGLNAEEDQVSSLSMMTDLEREDRINRLVQEISSRDQ